MTVSSLTRPVDGFLHLEPGFGFGTSDPGYLCSCFVQNIDKEKLQNIENVLLYYLDANPQFITQSRMDNIVDNLTSVLLDSAERTNSTLTVNIKIESQRQG